MKLSNNKSKIIIGAVAALAILLIVRVIYVSLTNRSTPEPVMRLPSEDSSAAASQEESVLSELLEESIAEESESAGNVGVPLGDDISSITAPTVEPENDPLALISGELQFSYPLVVPDSVQVADNSRLAIGKYYQLFPGERWSSRIRNNDLELIHEEGVVVSLSLSKYKITVGRGETKDEFALGNMVKPFIESLTEEYTTHQIYWGTEAVGAYAKALVSLETVDYVIRAGVISCNDETMSFIIVYDYAGADAKEEVLNGLLRSLQYNNKQISFK